MLLNNPHHVSEDARDCRRVVFHPPKELTISGNSTMDTEDLLASAIRRRCGGRIQGLRVRICGTRIVLRGWTTAYHEVQLAVAGLMEVLEQMNLDVPEEVELDIDVEPVKSGNHADIGWAHPR